MCTKIIMHSERWYARRTRVNIAKKNSLILILLNVNSVRSKCCHLRDLVIDHSIDIFCMSET